MSKIDLGSVSAFDIAVKNGYAGTEADWVNDIANASENAEAAQQSASEAQQSASQATAAAAASRADYTEVMSDFDVLSARMDEFTSLDDGSTTGDAELADIRVGADGTTYDSAGTAVRTQISDITSKTKNIANIDKVIIGKAWNGGANTARAIINVPVTPSTIYTVSFDSTGFDAVVAFEKVNESDTTCVWSDGITSPFTRTAGATTNCLCIQFNKSNISKANFANVSLQVEFNSVSTPYIQNKSAYDVFLRNEAITYVTPEMFGAWGDGEHDDTLALQTALDTKKNVIANGYYKITDSLSMTPVYMQGQKFEFNQIICSVNKVALKLNGRSGYINGLYLESNGSCVSFGEDGLTYNWHTHFSVIKSNGGNAIRMGGPEAVSEITIEGERFWYWSAGVDFDLSNYWVGQVAFKNMTFCTANENGEYAFFANGASHPLTGLSLYNVSLEGSHGGFNFVNTVAQYPIETLNCFGLRTSEMSVRDGYNVMRYTGAGVIRGVMVLDACMLSSFDFSNAPNMKECFIVQGCLMGDSTDDVYGMAVGQPSTIKPIRLANLI